MVIFLIILGIILLLAAALLFLPIPVSVRLVNKELSFRIFNLPYLKRRKKQMTAEAPVKEKKPVKFEDIKLRIFTGRKLYKSTKHQLKDLLLSLFKVAKVVYYRAVFTMGFDDPMNTGMAVGVAGAFLTEMNSFFHGLLLPSKQSYMSAVPNFNDKGLNFVAEFKLHISVFNALLFLKQVSKYKKDNQEGLNILFGGNVK